MYAVWVSLLFSISGFQEIVKFKDTIEEKEFKKSEPQCLSNYCPMKLHRVLEGKNFKHTVASVFIILLTMPACDGGWRRDSYRFY